MRMERNQGMIGIDARNFITNRRSSNVIQMEDGAARADIVSASNNDHKGRVHLTRLQFNIKENKYRKVGRESLLFLQAYYFCEMVF